MSYKEEKEFISKLQKYFNVELLNDSIFVFDDFKLLGTEITDSIKIYVKKTCMNNFKEFMNDNGYKRNTEDLFSDLYEKNHFTSIEVFDHKGANQTKESVIRDLFISNEVKNYKKIIKICENIINNYDEIKAKADEENL